MARNNNSTKLSLTMKRELDGLLEEGRMTLDDVRALIARCRGPKGAALPDALARSASNCQETVRILRESREIVRDIAGAVGEEDGEGACAKVIMEMLRGVVFKSLQAVIRDVDASFDATELAKLTGFFKEIIPLTQLERARAKRIREEEQARASEEWCGRMHFLGAAGDLKKLSDEELEWKINELAGRIVAPGAFPF